MSTHVLSKSQLMAWRQCPKRLWLQAFRPELADADSQDPGHIAAGHQVGAVARRLLDPYGIAIRFNLDTASVAEALELTPHAMNQGRPVFEGGFEVALPGGRLRAFADALTPLGGMDGPWRMVEVKSSGSVKPHHLQDAAIQAFVARQAGAQLKQVLIAHVDTGWVYSGDGDYQGLLKQQDVTPDVEALGADVARWADQAFGVLSEAVPPEIPMGAQCTQPYPCPFQSHCQAQSEQAEHPVAWLPGKLKAEATDWVKAQAKPDLRDIPPELLNERQAKVQRVHQAGQAEVNRAGARADLGSPRFPSYFMDFETVNLAVPRWAGTQPYQRIPFQFSVQRLGRAGDLEEAAFLDLTGDDPREAFARALTEACGVAGPIYVYNAQFEKGVLRELAEHTPRWAPALNAIADRVVDLLPVTRAHYYHPAQQGSWSIKAVLPTLPGGESYAALDGVADGNAAMLAYAEAVDDHTSPERVEAIRAELLRYCGLDTLAMVRLWRFLLID